MKFFCAAFFAILTTACSTPPKAISLVGVDSGFRSPSSTTQQEQDECRNASGVPQDNGFCLCGKMSFAPGYESCNNGFVTPVNVVQISEVQVPGPQAILRDGMQYRIAYKPLLVKFKSKSICYIELGIERVNDTRILPGGAGEHGGRGSCYARGNQCPDLETCLLEGNAAGRNSELGQALWEAKWIAGDFGTFQNTQQVLDDQERGSFTCYHPPTKQTKVFATQTQTQACDRCMFWGRDDVKSPYPFGCSVCDSPDAVKNNSARSCR